MEAAMYAARVLGDNMGILCTSERSAAVHSRTVTEYGFTGYFAGCEATKLGVLELDSKPRAEVHAVISERINHLVHEKGADCVLLGCAGMADMQAVCEASVEGSGARILDGVRLGIQFLVGLVRENLKTSKNGIFRYSSLDRVKRMQDWL